MAPESMLENRFSVKSDVLSFAVLIWKIMTMGKYVFIFDKSYLSQITESPCSAVDSALDF